MKNNIRRKHVWRRAFCFILAFCMMMPQMVFQVSAQEAEKPVRILVEGEGYSSVNFTLYDYEKDPGLSGGDFLLMKAPVDAAPPEEGFLAEYRFDAAQAGSYDFNMTCLAINGNLGSTIEVKVNDGEFKPYSEQNAVNHGVVNGQVYKNNFFRYTLDKVALRSGENKVTIKIASPRSTDNRYYYFLDCMEFVKSEVSEDADAVVMEGEHYDSINFVIPDYAKDPALSGGDFLCLKSYADNPVPQDGYQVVYKLTAEKTSAYEMVMTGLTLDGNNGSVFDMKINDGEYVHYDKTNSELLGIVDSAAYKNTFLIQKLPPVVLQAGENTISIRVTEPRAADGRQFFFLDCIRFTPISWNIKSVEPVNASVGVYELGDEAAFKVDYYSEASGAEIVEYKILDFWGNEAAAGTVQAQPGNDGMVIAVPDLARGHYMVYARAAGQADGPVDVLVNESQSNRENDIMISAGDVTDPNVSAGNVSAGNVVFGGNITVEAIAASAKADSGETEEIPWSVCQFSVVTPLSMREKPEDSPFALDAAMLMTYYKTPGFNIETALQYADALALAGVDTVRERYRWNEVVNPGEGIYDFDAFNTDIYLERLKQHGIKVLNMYDSSPDWAKENGDDRLVNDLNALYQFSRDSAVHYDGVVDAWEMANEPELANTMNYETADRLAAYIKAASIGYGDSGADPLISVPGLAYTPQYYADLMMQNDVLKYVDIYNYHNHIALDQGADITYPSMIYQAHRQLLDQYDGLDRQMWLSEAGTYVDLPQGQAELTHEQQIQMARYLVVSTLISLAEGTDKHFYFNLTYLVERDRELGIFGVNDTPYAPYSAQAAMTETFGEAVYQGTLKNCPEGAYALVFRNGEDTVIGIWADQEQTVVVPAAQGSSETQAQAELVDIMGNETVLNAQGEAFHVSAGINPQYLVIKGKLSEDAVEKDYRFGSISQRPDFTKAERVILEQKYPAAAAVNSKVNGYTMTAEEPTSVTVEVNNLNDEKMSGIISGKGYEGWNVTPAEQEVEVEPYGKVSLTFSIEATDAVVINTPASIQFTGEFNGEKTSNCVAHVQLPGEEHPEVNTIIPGADQKSSWGININTVNNGQCTITEGSREGSVTFANSFSGGDRWTYPVLTMPEGTDFTGTKGLTFHVDSEKDFEGGSVGVMRILLTEKNGSKYWTPDGFFLKEGEQQITVPWTAFSSMAGPADNNFHLDIDQIVQIELGLNSRVDVAPIYTVWDFGTYLGSTNAVYPVIERMSPATGTVLEKNNAVIEARIKDGSIMGSMDTIKVTVDGDVVMHEYDAETGKISAKAENLPNGIHKLNIQFFCEDGKGILSSSQIEVNNSAGPDQPDDNPEPDDNPGGDVNHPDSGEDNPSGGVDDGNNPEEDNPSGGQPDDNVSGGVGEGDQANAEGDSTNADKKSPKTYDNSLGKVNQPKNTAGDIPDTAIAGNVEKVVNKGLARTAVPLAVLLIVMSGVCAVWLRRRKRELDGSNGILK